MSTQRFTDNQKFPKELRVCKRDEFARVYRSQVYVADSVLVITAVFNDREVSRLGLSVSRKVGNAVFRNRWKRYIREAFRTQKLELPTGLDFVVRPRKGAECDLERIKLSLLKLLKKVHRKLGQSKL